MLSEIERILNSGIDASNDTFILIAASVYLLEEVSKWTDRITMYGYTFTNGCIV